MNNKNAILLGVAGIALLVAGFLLIRDGGGPGADQFRETVWFVDLGSGELFTADGLDVPPIPAQSGPEQGVRAFVYACGECTPDNRFVGYYLTTSPGVREQLGNLQLGPGQAEDFLHIPILYEQEGLLLVSAPDPVSWIPYGSPEAEYLQAEARRCPNGSQARPCTP